MFISIRIDMKSIYQGYKNPRDVNYLLCFDRLSSSKRDFHYHDILNSLFRLAKFEMWYLFIFFSFLNIYFRCLNGEISDIIFISKKFPIINGVSYGCISENITQGRSYLSMNIDISDCSFSRSLVFSGSGGVIYVNGGSLSMNVTYSMFNDCSCSVQGGAIYFISANCIGKCLCAFKCSAHTYQFAIFGASNSNSEDLLSVTVCSSSSNNGYESFRVYTGTQTIKNVNSSQNKVIWVSSMVFSDGSSSLISQSSFVNNSSNSCYCIYSSGISGVIQYINLIYNNSPLSYGVITVWSGSAEYLYSIFYNNSNSLFYINSGSISVKNSFIYHLGSFGSASTSNNSIFFTETYSHSFYSSYHCQTFPVLPDQTLHNTNIPEQTPHQSLFPEQTPIQSIFLVHTPYDTHHPVHTPYDTHYPVHTPYDTHYPVHTPYDTHHPDRTNQQSFPIDFIERTPSISSEQSNNNVDESKTSSAFMYSTVVLFIMILVILSYIVGTQRNPNKNHISTSSSSLDIKHKREENVKNEQENDNTTDRKRNHHHDYVSRPYVF